MAQRNEIAAVYVAAVIQGLALVTFPRPARFHQSRALRPVEHGIRRHVCASGNHGDIGIVTRGGLIRRLGIKRIYLLGLTANLVSMALLFLSQFVMSNGRLAYSMLLLATASLGIGFGLTVPALNTFTAAFFPQKIDSAVLVLNALLGLGTVLAPVFVAVFIGLGIWWGLPVLAVGLSCLRCYYSAYRCRFQGRQIRRHKARVARWRCRRASGYSPRLPCFMVFAKR
jgi:MFS family permease